MSPQYEKQLEASVRRELEALGEVPAPSALANRILAAIEQRAAAPWYRQSWATWPVGLRLSSLAVLLLAFAGVCFGAWQLTQGAMPPSWLSGWYADLCALWRTVGVLADTTVTLFSRIGTGFIIGVVAVMFTAWVMCIGLGTACVRLAMRPALNRI